MIMFKTRIQYVTHVLGLEVVKIIGTVTTNFRQRRTPRQNDRFAIVHRFDNRQPEALRDPPPETVTPEQTYYRLHGTKGSRHVHTDDELSRLRDRVVGRPSPYVMFNNLPRTGQTVRL